MIYADYNGSAPINNDVKEYLLKRLNEGPFANPNAIHHLGQSINKAMENSRALCAKHLGASPSQVFFNSGATEGLSQAFHSALYNNSKKKIIISGLEHSAVYNLAEHYKSEKGFEVIILNSLENGLVDFDQLKNTIDQDTALVSIMAVNNETGVIQPYNEIADLCLQNAVTYICDTTQLVGKGRFSFESTKADYAVMSGHKIGALTGTGILLAKDPTLLKPLIIGGGQENDLRGGTQNYLGFETLAVALNSLVRISSNINSLEEKRNEFETKLLEQIPQTIILGKDAPRLSTTSLLGFPGIHGQAVQIELESQGIFVTTSSACSDNEPHTSKVLKSMKVSDDIGRSVVRISLGLSSDPSVYDNILNAIIKAYEKLSKIKSY